MAEREYRCFKTQAREYLRTNNHKIRPPALTFLLPQHSSLPLRSSKLRLPLFPPSPRLSKMKSRQPCVDSTVANSSSNHYYKHDSRRDSNDPEIDI